MSVLGVIPARAGSKSIPEKNIADLNGKPLIAWSIEQAIKSGVIDCVFVSTDSSKIAEVAKSYGARCDFYRPKHLAGDVVGTGVAIQHVLTELGERGCNFDTVVELQPTYCFRQASTIRQVIEKLQSNSQIDSIVTCTEVKDTCHPDFVMKLDPNGCLEFGIKKPDQFARQNLSPSYAAKGIVLAARVEFYLRKKTFFADRSMPFLVDDPLHAIDINDPTDLELANAIALSNPNIFS